MFKWQQEDKIRARWVREEGRKNEGEVAVQFGVQLCGEDTGREHGGAEVLHI